MNISIAVINESTAVTDAQVQPVVAALQKQLDNDFCPHYGNQYTLAFYSSANVASVPPADWQLVVLDNSDQAGALGYHDFTLSGGPIGKVFAKTDIDTGSSWSVTMSHELTEMCADPNINGTVQVDNYDGKGNTAFYAYEVSDACEADAYGYQIDGILLSDFVLPNFWFPGATAPYDLKGHITAPLQILAGGYLSLYPVGTGNGWTQVYGSDKFGRTIMHHRMRPNVGSRRERRSIPQSQRLRSVRYAK